MVIAATTSVAAVLLGGCIATSGGGPDGTTDPLAGRACPADEPHLIIGLAPTTWDGSSVVVRRDRNLRACRGMTIDRDQGYLVSVAGTSRGHDLLGFDSGRLFLVDGSESIWGIEHESYGMEVGAVFTMEFQGRQVAGVLWVDSYNSGDSIDLLDLESGEPLQHYDVSSSVIGAARSTDGSSDRISGLIEWEGIQEYRAEPGAASLGMTGELQIATPRAGEFGSLVITDDRAIIGAEQGVLWWPRDESLAFLGPVTCRWPVFSDGTIPDGDEDYVAAVQDLDSGEHFLAAADGTLQGAESSGYYLFRFDTRGECELLITADEDHRFTSLSWSGL